jgi:hypothetical protein
MIDPKMSSFNPDLIVVIRTVGERTFETCRNLVIQQIPENLVYIVSEQPFEATLRRCYEIGIASGAKWMMTLDADVLLRENAIQDFLTEAGKLPENYFQIEGLLHDKLTGLYRKVGHRMYRTKYLEKALECLPQPRETIRPEYTALLRMEQLGYLSLEIGTVFGIHDYEQYLNDIYRKAFVHAQKHPEWIPRFIEQWKEKADEDDDCRIALRGLYDGLMFTGKATIDKRDFIDNAKIALQNLNLSEKDQLTPGKADLNLVNSILLAVGIVPADRLPGQRVTNQLSRTQRMKEKYTQLGLTRFFIYSLGVVLSRVGELLKRKMYTY